MANLPVQVQILPAPTLFMPDPSLSELVAHQQELETMCLSRFKRGQAVLEKIDLSKIMADLYTNRPDNITGADLTADFIEKVDEAVSGLTKDELADFFVMWHLMKFSIGVNTLNKLGL